jgi:hypothetical protein
LDIDGNGEIADCNTAGGSFADICTKNVSFTINDITDDVAEGSFLGHPFTVDLSCGTRFEIGDDVVDVPSYGTLTLTDFTPGDGDGNCSRCCELPVGFDSAGNRFGVFTGILIQESERYIVTMTYSSAGMVTDYPALSCGHKSPMPVTVAAKGQLEWTEQLDYGSEGCLDGGNVTLTQKSENEWDYRWEGSDGVLDGPATFQCFAECT